RRTVGARPVAALRHVAQVAGGAAERPLRELVRGARDARSAAGLGGVALSRRSTALRAGVPGDVPAQAVGAARVHRAWVHVVARRVVRILLVAFRRDDAVG